MKFSVWIVSFSTVLVLGVALELVTLIHLGALPYQPNLITGIADVEAGGFLLLAPLSPILLVVVLYTPISFLVFWVIRQRTETTRWKARLRPLSYFLMSLRTVSQADIRTSLELKSPRLLLVVAVVSSAYLAYLPYRPDLNPTASLVGVDSPLYVSWVSQMLERTPSRAVAYAFSEAAGGSRPFFLILLYSVALLGGIGPQPLVEYLPLILGPLLCLSSYLFVWSGQSSEKFAGLASLLTAFSFNASVGMWGGFYANWFAMAEGYIFLSLLLRSVDSFSAWRYAAMVALSIGLMLSHPWTWAVILATSLVFTVSLRARETPRGSKGLFRLLTLFPIIAAGLIADFLKNLEFQSRTLVTDLSTKSPVFGPSQLVAFWPNVVSALRDYYGGLLSNSLVFAFAVLAFLTLRFGDRFDRLLMAWLGSSAIPFALFASFHQTRLVYDLPMPILATIGLSVVAHRLRRYSARLTYLLLILTILSQANYALRAVYQLP